MVKINKELKNLITKHKKMINWKKIKYELIDEPLFMWNNKKFIIILLTGATLGATISILILRYISNFA